MPSSTRSSKSSSKKEFTRTSLTIRRSVRLSDKRLGHFQSTPTRSTNSVEKRRIFCAEVERSIGSNFELESSASIRGSSNTLEEELNSVLLTVIETSILNEIADHRTEKQNENSHLVQPSEQKEDYEPVVPSEDPIIETSSTKPGQQLSNNTWTNKRNKNPTMAEDESNEKENKKSDCKPSTQAIAFTPDQFESLMERLFKNQVSPTISCNNGDGIPSGRPTGNFAFCKSRFDGKNSDYVNAFVNTIFVYKNSTNMSDENALLGFPLVLEGEASIWWEGVKSSVKSFMST